MEGELLPKTQSPPVPDGNPKPVTYGRVYKCKKCGMEFRFVWELGHHSRQELMRERKENFGRDQFNKLPKDVDGRTKIIKVEHIRGSTRIFSSFFIPNDWEYVRVHEPIKTEAGLWVLFEPLRTE